MAVSTTSPAPEPITFGEGLARFGDWCRREPLAALLLAACLGVLVYFFGFYRVFVDGAQSTAVWAWRAWNPENDLDHGPIILPIALFVVWYHRQELADARKAPSLLGLALVGVGALTFVLSVRTLQPRIAMFSLPVLAYGMTRYLWGRETARLIIFPCVFLLFMIPVGFLITRTVVLQNLAASVAVKLSNLLGVGVVADGAQIMARDGSFQFEVAGGCSGIRSLTAMTMLAALYVHFTQNEAWKKLAIFGSSLVFALIGNLMRIFTVVLFARFISAGAAVTLYHDYSGFVFFPIAVGAMVGFANLLNRNWKEMMNDALKPDPALARPATVRTAPATAGAVGAPVPSTRERKPAGPAAPISYDY